MKNGTFVFVLTLLLFATGTTAIAFSLAMDAAKLPPLNPAPAQNIPWYCVKIIPPSGNGQVTNPIQPIGLRGNSVGPSVAIEVNPGKLVRSNPITTTEINKNQKAKPDLPKQTNPTRGTGSGDGTQTPGYSSGGSTGGSSGSGTGGSTVSKNGSGTPAVPGYYGNGSSGNTSPTNGGTSIILPDGSVYQGFFDPTSYSKLVYSCPNGYIANIGPRCFELISKKFSGKLTQADIDSPAYKLCMQIVSPTVLNSKATPELCSAYKKYVNMCSSTQGKSCLLEKFVKESGIPSKDVLKTIRDLSQNCWLISI